MIVFSDNYTEDVKKLHETMKYMEIDVKIVVLEDEGFLPDGISTPYEYYILKQNQEQHVERDLFYDSLEVPEYSAVCMNSATAGIYYMGRELATIYFYEQWQKSGADSIESEKRQIVQRVEWHMEGGWTYRIDFYNKYGLKYASEFRDAEGTIESKSFYSDRNQEVITECPGNDVVTLVENGMVKAFFNSRREFIEHYVAEISQDEKWASFVRDEKRLVFVQDEKMLESLPMKPDAEQGWSLALFPNDELLNKYMSMGGKGGVRFWAIPEHYPENMAKGEALILTNSDQIEKLEELVQGLPNVVFHIAANTLVSDKLKNLGEKENVCVYPGVSQVTLDELWERCDFYLDINYRNEIRDAVNMAHQKNLLIMGFVNTLHHNELLIEECIYSVQEYEKMVYAIEHVMGSPELMQKLLMEQQRRRKVVWKKLLESTEMRED